MPLKPITGFNPLLIDFPEIFWAIFYADESRQNAELVKEAFPEIPPEKAQVLIDLWNHKPVVKMVTNPINTNTTTIKETQ